VKRSEFVPLVAMIAVVVVGMLALPEQTLTVCLSVVAGILANWITRLFDTLR
jgi:hypothetical protein